jgi:hypothetical protein
MKVCRFKICLFAFGLAVSWMTAACSKKDEAFSSSSGKKKEEVKEDSEIDVDGEKRGVEGIDSFQALKGTGFVVKNYLQLKAAAKVCLGANLGLVNDSMFAANRCPNQTAVGAPAEGNEKLEILGVDKCSDRGKNIYDALKSQLWAPELAGRTDTLSNDLTPNYLQALALAGDVYAHTVTSPGNLCDTEEKAQELLERCLPLYSKSKIEAVAPAIHESCKEGAIKAREAIATILGSAAFAAASPSNAATEGK